MDLAPGWEARLDAYTDQLAVALRASGWCGSNEAFCRYCGGLLLPGERKSMEPMAARLDPEHVQACHSSLQRLITDSVWDHRALLKAVREFGLPRLTAKHPLEAWIGDDTSFPKKGTHSVGVAHQYCGNLGKQANCQVAVSISLATGHGSLPAAYQLYLPEVWTQEPERCRAAGVPQDVVFRKKWEIALALTDQLLLEGVPKAPFLWDAGYGPILAFRQGLTERGFVYAVGVRGDEPIWPPGWTPLAPGTRPPGAGRRRADHLRQNPEMPLVTAKAWAMGLPPEAWQDVTWRQGTQGPLCSRFVAARVRPAQGCYNRKSDAIYRIPQEEWLLAEWPAGEPEPTRFWLSTFPETTPINTLAYMAKLRWRIEEDYEELKQEFGLADFEGRTWQGFHHHGSLCIATRTFMMAERSRLFPPTPGTAFRLTRPAVPGARPWRRPASKGRAS